MSLLKGSKKYLRITLFLFCGILVLNSNLFAQSPDDLMNEGNRFYQSGQYENALEVYHKILSQGYESSALYYNLGNAYFKTNKLGYAVLYYEKGLKLSPGDEDILYNLKIANARTVDQITEVPKLFIIQWWELLITTLSLPGWALVTIIVYLIFILSIGMYLLSKRMKIQRWAFMSGSISLSVLIIAIVILFARYNQDATTNYGVLVDSIYTVKASPDTKSNDAFVIHEGLKFAVEDHLNNWSKIRLLDGKVGWIEDKTFSEI